MNTNLIFVKVDSFCAISGIIIFNEETYNRSHKKMAGHTWLKIVFYVVLVLIVKPIYRSNTLTTWLQDLLSTETSFNVITKAIVVYKTLMLYLKDIEIFPYIQIIHTRQQKYMFCNVYLKKRDKSKILTRKYDTVYD